MHFKGKGGGECNEKTPISQIGLKGGGPQKFKLQKCIKWRIVRLQTCWWSDRSFPLRRPSRQQRPWGFLTFPSRDGPGPEGPVAPLPAVSAGPRAGVAGPDSSARRPLHRPSGGGSCGGHRAARQANSPLPRRPPPPPGTARIPRSLSWGRCVCVSTITPTPPRDTGTQQTQGHFLRGRTTAGPAEEGK